MALLVLSLSCSLSCRPRACSTDDNDASSTVAEAPRDAAPESTSADDVGARKLLDAWNGAHGRHDAAAFDRIYASRVTFYGRPTTRKACVETKAALFARSPDFAQTLRDVHVEISDGGAWVRLLFVKTVTMNGQTRDYPAYLTARREGAAVVVVEESDTITDKNLAARANAPRKDPCVAALQAVIDEVGRGREGKYREVDEWVPCEEDQCIDRHQLVDDGESSRAPRMVWIRISLSTGEVTSTGGWSMADLDEGTVVPVTRTTRERVVKSCRGKRPRGDW